jgi:uncharacterized protein YjbI with pentapeptide repeats
MEFSEVCQICCVTSCDIHREFIGAVIVTAVVEGRKQHAGEKEARKRTWRRGPQDQTRRSKAWTLREFGGKTVWEWLQLLIVPVILSLITVVFTWQQNARQQDIEDQRAQAERTIEEQRAQDAALQAYLDQMSQLMLEGDLRGSEEGSEVRTLARARTRTVLARLDGSRKGRVVQFLYEASLINKERPVVSLSLVGLRGADLSGLTLKGANLSDADLIDADLRGANLSDANVSEADLSGAKLSWAVLSGADLSGLTLKGANLSNADLIDADLRGANLSDADLSGAYLSQADLSGAYLIDANLRVANVSEADLSGAYLSRADLSGANLSSANLSSVNGVTDEQLEKQAKTLEGAVMPDGSIHD